MSSKILIFIKNQEESKKQEEDKNQEWDKNQQGDKNLERDLNKEMSPKMKCHQNWNVTKTDM